VWASIVDVRTIMENTSEPDLKLRCSHAITQAAGTYGRLVEAGELENRIASLENAAQSQGGT
jgi:hypothetical protein